MNPQLTVQFAAAGCRLTPKKKRMAPLSVRVSKEQRAELERRAVDMSLNAYVLSCLFDSPRRTRKRKEPSKRDKALARALRRLGRCGLITYLTTQIVAVEEGRLQLSDSEEKDLRQCYEELQRMRSDLLAAMGLEG